jgi:hypothetical protein
MDRKCTKLDIAVVRSRVSDITFQCHDTENDIAGNNKNRL